MLHERRKLLKQKQKEKRARLVVRNLPFSTTEENLKEYYEKFGEVVGVDLLRKPDGKLVGCAFIQFKLVQNAAKARHHTNGKEFIGRNIECDFAMAKHKYEERLLKETEIKQEDIEIKQEIDVKQEPTDDYEYSISNNSSVEIKKEDIKTEQEPQEEEKQESNTSEAMEMHVEEEKTEESALVKEDEESNEPEGNQDQDEDMETDDEEKQPDKEETEDEEEQSDKEETEDMSETESKAPENSDLNETESVPTKKPRVISNDVVEGKTVFIKNVPFNATNDDLKKCMSQFGPLYYALICIDKLTEHSKGTAFVKFRVK